MSLPIPVQRVGNIVDIPMFEKSRVCPAIVTARTKDTLAGHINCIIFDSEVLQFARVKKNLPHESITGSEPGKLCWRERK